MLLENDDLDAELHRSFEEWAVKAGDYDPDSRAAEQIYLKARADAWRLRAFFDFDDELHNAFRRAAKTWAVDFPESQDEALSDEALSDEAPDSWERPY